MTESVREINFFDEETNDCPFHAYAELRQSSPVWKDPVTNFYVISRYDDVRAAILDTKRFTNQVALSNAGSAMEPDDPEKARELLEAAALEEEVQRLYREKGWVPAANLDALDEPRHMEMRRLFDYAFRPGKIKELDPFVEELAYRLVDDFLGDGRCEVVAQLAVPLPLYTIGRQIGVPEEDMPRIKEWTDAWVQRMGLAQTPEERIWSTEMEIEAQQYLQPIYERLREQPDDTLLSVIVNREVPEWGRSLTHEELHSEVIVDLFVGGSETTTNAIAAGVVKLIEQPEIWDRLKAEPDAYLETFIEEVVRLEAPVQALMRQVSEDIELHGTTIPEGSLVLLLYGSANRDERRFECPADIDLERKKPRSHLGFGTGSHHCLGAPLARRELYYGFRALLDRVDRMWFIEGANDFGYQPNYFFRALRELHVGFEAAA
jgi:cytochrome P450